VLTALSRYIAPRLGLLDSPDDAHKIHKRTVALGGWAIACAALPIFALVGTAEFWKLTLGSLLALLTGLLDDRFGLSPKAKLVGQLLCACVTVLVAGWGIQSVRIFGVELALGWLTIPFTLFWISGAINAFNLIDGLDGLATGSAAIIFGTTAFIAHQSLSALLGSYWAFCSSIGLRQKSFWATAGRTLSATGSRFSPCKRHSHISARHLAMCRFSFRSCY